MNLQRNFFFIVLLLILFLIWQKWGNNQSQSLCANQIIKQENIFNYNNKSNIKYKNNKIIIVKTDVLELHINTYGGDINQANLLLYNEKLHSSDSLKLLQTNKDFIYQAQSGLIGKNGPDNLIYNNGLRPIYYSSKVNYILDNNKNELRVPLTFIGKDGVIYQKVYLLKRGKYDISIEYNINNKSSKPLKMIFFGQLKQTKQLSLNCNTKKNNFNFNTYRGAAYSSDRVNYKKYTFQDIENNDLNINTKGGWVAMLQQYFTTAWIPNKQNQKKFYTINLNKNIAIIGYKSLPFVIGVNNIKKYTSTLWIGPALQEKMSIIAPYLDLTVNYGWLWFISQPLFKLLKIINSFVINWGFSIIIITFVIRSIMYPLTKAQYISMIKIRSLQPKLTEIKKQFNNNKQRINQEIISLYKSEKINPLGGFLPLLIQMPIFLALYYMLMNSIELRHAPFIAWIQDLSAPDPYYILPLLMGLTIYITQIISPKTTVDSIQNKIMIYMPVIFTMFFLYLPSGLVLYYTINNLITIIQQQIIYSGLEKSGLYVRNK